MAARPVRFRLLAPAVVKAKIGLHVIGSPESLVGLKLCSVISILTAMNKPISIGLGDPASVSWAMWRYLKALLTEIVSEIKVVQVVVGHACIGERHPGVIMPSS